MSNDDISQYSHRIFKNDPIKFKNYVNKQVSVIAKDSSIHNGILYTVDPVSESVVLVEPDNEGKFKVKVVVGHSIEDIQISVDSTSNNEKNMDIDQLFSKKQSSVPEPDIIKRKEAIKKLLNDNRFPITEDSYGVFKINEMISIEPPYNPENCLCTNPVVLTRIQKILSQASTE